MRAYRVGIIGFGMIGKVHAYGYAALPFTSDPVPLQARIVRVATGRRETAQKAAQMLGCEGVTDPRAITEAQDIDIVHICTPNHLHRDALLSAIQHNKHIYCDKPLTANWAEAQEILAVLPAYRAVGQMTFHNRFFPSMMRAKQLVEEGRLGRPLQFRAVYLHSGSARPETPLRWKLSAQAGGGVTADLASHLLDLVWYLLGDFKEVFAHTQIAFPQRPAPDDPQRMLPVDAEEAVWILARMQNGAEGLIEASKLATGAEDELRLEIHGTEGAVRFSLMDPHHLGFYDANRPEQPCGGQRGWTLIDCGHRYPAPATEFPARKAAIGWQRAHVECLANFLRGVAAAQHVQPDLVQGVYVQHLIDRVLQSAKTGQWMPVQPRQELEAAARRPSNAPAPEPN
ncbi:MAG: Gfo/Idh/MocA family oxidoreductase [Thermoguttaceae bacterium]|nr:Gfo/Idh/MocA family oxidoreductase [Thermoguttaceae bacterium]MDW8037924.1 Gfo/Idh/MocA family oxidoreductase [Thermoguttaceae bacterium]